MRLAAIAVVLTGLLIPSSSFCADFKPWVAANGAWATYNMSDVNDEIGGINAFLGGSGLSMHEISNGFGFGLSVGGDFGGPVTVGLGYERLFGSSEVGDASGSIKYDLPANTFRAFLESALPASGQFKPRVGLVAGLVSASGSVTVTETGVGSVSSDVSGIGPEAEFYLASDVWAAPKFAVCASLGYRYAKIGEVKVGDQIMYNDDRSKYTLDYSGFVARLGIKFAFKQ